MSTARSQQAMIHSDVFVFLYVLFDNIPKLNFLVKVPSYKFFIFIYKYMYVKIHKYRMHR